MMPTSFATDAGAQLRAPARITMPHRFKATALSFAVFAPLEQPP
jgi:hypothetical protein